MRRCAGEYNGGMRQQGWPAARHLLRVVSSPLRRRSVVLLEPGDDPEPTPPAVRAVGRLLLHLAAVERAQGGQAHVLAVELEGDAATVALDSGHGRASVAAPITASREQLTELLAPHGLGAPRDWTSPVVPGDGEPWWVYWAEILEAFGTSGWTFREAQYDLALRTLSVLPDRGAVAVFDDGGVTRVVVLPIPPSGDVIGLPFEIRDRIRDDAGDRVAPGVWAAAVDEYEDDTPLPGWARDWLRHFEG